MTARGHRAVHVSSANCDVIDQRLLLGPPAISPARLSVRTLGVLVAAWTLADTVNDKVLSSEAMSDSNLCVRAATTFRREHLYILTLATLIKAECIVIVIVIVEQIIRARAYNTPAITRTFFMLSKNSVKEKEIRKTARSQTRDITQNELRHESEKVGGRFSRHIRRFYHRHRMYKVSSDKDTHSLTRADCELE